MSSWMDCSSCSCVFCFNELKETETYESLFGKYGDMLNTLLIQVNFENLTTQPLACAKCIEKIKSAFDFKSACIETMKILIPYTDSTGNVTADLKTVYCKEKDSTADMNDNKKVCRLCMKLFNSYLGMALGQTLEELHFTNTFFKHIPEIVNQFVEKPVICNSCVIDLQQFSDLIFMSSFQNSDTDDLNLPLFPPPYRAEEPEDIKEIEIVDTNIVKNEPAILNEFANKELSIQIPRIKIEKNLNDTTANLLKNPIDTEETQDVSMQEVKQEEVDTCSDAVIPKQEDTNDDSSNVNGTCSTSSSLLKYEISDDDDDCIIVDVVQDEIIDVGDNESIKLRDVRPLQEDEQAEYDFVDEYECDICFFKEGNPAKFYEHEETHDKKKQANKIFSCSICSFKTKGLVGKEVHMLAWHKAFVDKKNITCKFCKFSTHYVYYYQDHLKIHNYDKNYIKCKKCAYKTKYKDILRVHHDKVHKTLSPKKYSRSHKNNFESLDYEEETQSESSSKRFFRCHCCKYKALRKRKFETHMKTEHQIFQCEDCNYVSMNRLYFKTHTNAHIRNIPLELLCSFCSFETHSQSLLRSHMNVHSGSKRREFICKKCRFITTSKPHFMEHMLAHRPPKN